MNFEYLNEMINYIEENITEKIEYKELARIVGVSEYSLQRIFIFLTSMSLSEYIRKRRLSKAFEEIKITGTRIIDIAIKYGYDSSISFSRAFKNMFGITPSECRNNGNKLKTFPIINFSKNTDNKVLEYEIKELDDKIIYCYEVSAINYDDLLYYIRKLYENLKEKNIYYNINLANMYGIFAFKDNKYFYYVGDEKKRENSKKIILPKGKYVIFNVGSREQKDIIETEQKIYSQWLPSTKYELNYKNGEEFDIEVYKDNNCYIYIKIK